MTNLYDDPQINGEDYRQAAEWGNFSTEDIQIDADAEVSVGDDGAYVQAWVYVSAEDALDKARDRQAENFNRSYARMLGRSESQNDH